LVLVQNEKEVDELDISPLERPVAYVTQTTLSVDDTRASSSVAEEILRHHRTRDATSATRRRNRHRRCATLESRRRDPGGRRAELFNSNRLREIGAEEGIPSYLIADGSALEAEWVKGAEVVGLTAGASAPEVLVDSVIDALAGSEPVEVSTLPGREEHMEFRLPAELTEGFATRTVSRAS